MKTYHVTYYYCATGMEGRADTRDHGLIQANSEQDAIEQLGKRLYPKSDKLTQTWGLMAKEIRDYKF
jgi:hypothetical protein